MEVIYSSSDSYAEVLAVSIVSLCENNSEADRIRIHVISNGISETNCEELRRIANEYCREIEIIKMPDLCKMADTAIDFKHHNMVTFARLCIGEIFPELDRAIFLDCDTIVLRSLQPLWDMQFQDGKICAGVLDAISRFNKRKVGLQKNDAYINAGVLLADLKRWREQKVAEAFFAFLRRKKGSVPLVDQGVLNGVISRQLQPVDARYNFMTFGFAFSYHEIRRYKKFCGYYTEESFEDAKDNIVVAHATGSFLLDRPWLEHSNYPLKEKWLCYREKTKWSGKPLWPNNVSIADRILRRCAATALRRPMIEALGIVQATLKG